MSQFAIPPKKITCRVACYYKLNVYSLDLLRPWWQGRTWWQRRMRRQWQLPAFVMTVLTMLQVLFVLVLFFLFLKAFGSHAYTFYGKGSAAGKNHEQQNNNDLFHN